MSNKELPKGWCWFPIKDICVLVNGCAFKPEDWSSTGLPIVRIQNLNNHESPFNYCDFEVDRKYFIDNGQLLFAWSGTPGTSFGAHIWNRGKAILNQHIFKVEINQNEINKQFLMYLLNYNVREYIQKAHGTAGLAHITKGKFENSLVSLPPLPEQHVIVARLEELFSDLDNGVDSLKQAQAQLKTYRQAVLKYAFEGKLTAEWRTQQRLAPAADLLEQIQAERAARYQRQVEEWQQACAQVKAAGAKKPPKPKKPKDLPPLSAAELAELPELPEGWCWVRLGSLLEELKYGTSKKCAYDVKGKPVLRIPNISEKGLIDQEDLKYADFNQDEIKIYSLRKDDILTIRSNGSVSLVGKTALVSKKEEGFLYAGYLIRLRVYLDIVSSKFINYVLRSPVLRPQIERKAKSTSGVNNINTDELNSLIMPHCSYSEQHQIVQEIETRLSVCEQLEQTIAASLRTAESLRQSLLKHAFEGKLTAPWRAQHPHLISGEHSAAALLEKIKKEKIV